MPRTRRLAEAWDRLSAKIEEVATAIESDSRCLEEPREWLLDPVREITELAGKLLQRRILELEIGLGRNASLAHYVVAYHPRGRARVHTGYSGTPQEVAAYLRAWLAEIATKRGGASSGVSGVPRPTRASHPEPAATAGAGREQGPERPTATSPAATAPLVTPVPGAAAPPSERGVAASASRESSPTPEFPQFVKIGETWQVTWAGRTKGFAHRDGFAALNRLLERPGTPLSTQAALGEHELPESEPDRLMDKRALAAARVRLTKLDAGGNALEGEERKRLRALLNQARVPGGRQAVFASRAKADYDRVRTQLTSVYKALKKQGMGDLAEHLRAHVQLGRECLYRLKARPGRRRAPS